jgi:hypothetical protein
MKVVKAGPRERRLSCFQQGWAIPSEGHLEMHMHSGSVDVPKRTTSATNSKGMNLIV